MSRSPSAVAELLVACATVDLEKLRHSTPLAEINNVVHNELLFLAPWTVDAIQG